MSKYLDLKNGYNINDLKEAAEIIKNGGLVLFPTETVYGIGADGLNSKAVDSIFVAKGRAQDNPLILHVSSCEMIKRIVSNINELEQKLIDEFFPGPLTIIFDKKEIVPLNVCGGLSTVGVRMPSNPIAHDLIELSDTPIAAPSANISGKPSGTNIDDIFDELHDRVDYILDGGETLIGVESTVVRVENNTIHILRPGKITEDDLRVFADVIVDKHVLGKIETGDKIMSPGMKYRHYAPKTKCVLVTGSNRINKMIELEKDNKDSLVICNQQNINNFINYISYGETLEEISHNIFKILREVDKKDASLVIIEGVTTKGLGLAIMNRLIRACGYNVINEE